MDEEPDLRELVEGSLFLMEFDVSTFASGEDLLVKFSEEPPPDVVILDLNVKNRMGAVETLRNLLQIGYGGMAVVSSGYLFEGEKVDGFDATLPKPYWPRDLKNIIEEVLKEKKEA